MQFKPESINAIVNGTKTETRRVVKPGETLEEVELLPTVIAVTGGYPKGRLKWQVGRDYAVSPGRGFPGAWVCFDHPRYGYDIWEGSDPVSTDSGLVDWRKIAAGQGYQPLRIRLLEIRREPLQAITLEDVIAEGIPQYTLARGVLSETPPDPRWKYRELWESINGAGSWDANPDVWVLRFEVVK